MPDKKLPLMVLYDTGESWFVKPDKLVAIFIDSDREAVYVKDIEKTDYLNARDICDKMEDDNLFWCIPTDKQLQKLLNVFDEFNETAKLTGAEPMKKGKYWSKRRLYNGVRVGVNFGLEKEVAISECEYAYTRPFLRL